MLTELRLENYAVIDNLVVEFGHGLNLLTGETGAGKSILIDALALLLGEKASTDVIRGGADRAVISAVFEADGTSKNALTKILEANGLDDSGDGSVILRREISASGKGMKRLKENNSVGKGSFELMELSPEETVRVKNYMAGVMKTSALPFFLGCSLFALSRQAKLLTGKYYFIPVPVDRRPPSGKNSLLSNFISFLYFNADDSELVSLEKTIQTISKQMISQAKKKQSAVWVRG